MHGDTTNGTGRIRGMGHQQKGKGKKRPRGWHRRGYGPDNAFRNAMRRIDRAAARTKAGQA